MKTMKILTVDDNPNILAMVKMALEQTGRYEVQTENHSTQALTAALAYRPDLVLLDIDMPTKDGGDVAAEIQSQPTLRNVPLVFLTSLVAPNEHDLDGHVCGNAMVIAKPVRPEKLIQTVDRIINQAALASAK
jgi:CheY-like chemotaxis protein